MHFLQVFESLDNFVALGGQAFSLGLEVGSCENETRGKIGRKGKK